MAVRIINRLSRFQRFAKVLDFLKWNTDKDHPITVSKMRSTIIDSNTGETMDEYMGDKQTFNRLIKDMARYYNADNDIDKPEDEWKIYFRDWKKMYDNGGILDNIVVTDKVDKKTGDTLETRELIPMHITGLHYNRTFSYDELDLLIEGIWSNNTLDTETADMLSRKICNTLGTKYYKYKQGCFRKIKEAEICDKKLLKANIDVISKAIEKNVQIEFRFNGYTYDKKLDSGNDKIHRMSPYYLVMNNGKYYLLGCYCDHDASNKKRKLFIFRVDLMTDVSIPGENKRLGIAGEARIPIREVEGLPEKWSDDFILSHINMSYDKPEWITLRVFSEKEEGNPNVRKVPNYAYLHDWFGDNFRFIKVDDDNPNYDIVNVYASVFGIVNWALQYSDRVEVLEPEDVRKKVIKKIENLNKKYHIDTSRKLEENEANE